MIAANHLTALPWRCDGYLVQFPVEDSIAVYRHLQASIAAPVPGLDIVVLFPFELYVGPYILRFSTAFGTVFAQTIVNKQLYRLVVGDANEEFLTSVLKIELLHLDQDRYAYTQPS